MNQSDSGEQRREKDMFYGEHSLPLFPQKEDNPTTKY
jgi:hypothetical protein